MSRAEELRRTLDLVPHPEGGWYREIHRSPHRVSDGRRERAAVTTIYFLLESGEHSRWHRVASEEIWHHHEGAPLELLVVEPDTWSVSSSRLGPLDGEQAPCRVVRAGRWQAARTTGEYTLVACTVAPGFEFDDFTLLDDDERAAAAIASVTARRPDLAGLL